ncbi:transglutaminase [Halobacteriales archaeon QS_8_69_26]|nr:MAG: transglutaminase [Halobacteriales archaeon QS_8_69_26]
MTVEPSETLSDLSEFRLAALVGTVALTLSYVGVLANVTGVVGGTSALVLLVVVSAAGGLFAARVVGERLAAVVGVVLMAGGLATYLAASPIGLVALVTQTKDIVADTVALMTGLSVLRMVEAGLWALGFAPGPVFLSWYLVARRRYLAGSLVGGAALLFLVLTGDATPMGTLAGVLGGIAAVGFGELDRREGTLLQADVLVVLVALITVTSLTLSLVPGGAADPLQLNEGGGAAPSTVEASLLNNPDRSPIVGSISLSPEVRFTVTADEERYWRVGVYDRFTGGSWIRTGRTTDYGGRLSSPPGPRRTVVQTYEVEGRTAAMPAAGEPVEVIGDAATVTKVTDQRNLKPSSTFIQGDRYRVRSEVPDATPDELRNAGDDYPSDVRDRYLQLPESTTDRFRDAAASVTADADNPYDAAVQVEEFLEANKTYSLDVERPRGNIADAFLFEMDEGYCTYFATTMVAMLRAEGIPARMAVGYTPGQQVDDDTYVVRGLNAHAWVEVYFPDYGWVKFDPTPSAPRRNTEVEAIQEAREGGGGGVDTDESTDATLTTVATTSGTNGTTGNGTAAQVTQTIPGFGPEENPGGDPNDTLGNRTVATPTDPGGGPSSGLPPLPSPEQTAIGAVVLLGAAAGAHRTGLDDRTYRIVRMHWQGDRGEPVEDVRRAYERLELLLAREHRPRRPGETPREYVDTLSAFGIDPAVREVAEIHEQARYAGRADREDADEAIRLVDRLVRERTPVIGSVYRRLN